jgi:hypothetical protein
MPSVYIVDLNDFIFSNATHKLSGGQSINTADNAGHHDLRGHDSNPVHSFLLHS